MCFSLENFKKSISFTSKGRASRSEFWSFFVFSMIALFAVIGLFYFAVSYSRYNLVAVGFLLVAYGAFLSLLSIFVCSRRLHDTGRSGALVWLIPTMAFLALVSQDGSKAQYVFAGLLALSWLSVIAFCAFPSEKAKNKYGAVPAE